MHQLHRRTAGGSSSSRFAEAARPSPRDTSPVRVGLGKVHDGVSVGGNRLPPTGLEKIAQDGLGAGASKLLGASFRTGQRVHAIASVYRLIDERGSYEARPARHKKSFHRCLLRQALGDRFAQEATGLLVGRKQRFDALAQGRVAGAGFVQVR